MVRRELPAHRERVFQAWTEPEQLRLWAGPGPMRNITAEVDLRVGGRYRITMLAPDGKEFIVAGVYRLIDAPKKLIYTWFWETDPQPTETLVTVEFIARGRVTELVLTHERFTSQEQVNGHTEGWNGCLEKLIKECLQ